MTASTGSMVERVARAIEHAHKHGGGADAMARAAIEAMREPTEAMTKAGREFLFANNRRYEARHGRDAIQHAEWTGVMRAMIDAALAPAGAGEG